MIDIKKRLEGEIKTLDYELKVQLPKEIQKAREHGDLRENAEYHAAREQHGFNEGRIAEIEGKLALAQVIDVTKLAIEEAAARCAELVDERRRAALEGTLTPG